MKFLLFSQFLFFFSAIGLGQVTNRPISPDTSNKTILELPSPFPSFPSPPFPMSDWAGGAIIGEASGDSPDFLMKAILKMSKKSWPKWHELGIKAYGWIDVSMNGSTSKQTNSPMSYDLVPNRPELDQAILRIERVPDIGQRKHIDWGFLSDNIFGIDYRYTIAKGIVSDQLLKHNNLYGFDPTQLYGLLYIPNVAQGMLVKVGRFISPADIEAQWAPDNYLFSHSLMFSVDPYTFTGMNTTIRLQRRIQIELGVHAGNDMAPWSNSAQINGLAMIRWVSKNNRQSLYGGINSLGNGQYENGHDDLQMVSGVWGCKFTEKIHMMTEAYYIWQSNAALGGTAIYGPAQYGQGGGMGSIIPGISKAIGLVNYFQILCSPKDYISIRNDALNDINGNRTGYSTWYTSHTVGFSHHFSNYLITRPEIRYEQAWNNHNVTPYDMGTKKSQFTGAVDLVIRF
jgi:hypothetical protein